MGARISIQFKNKRDKSVVLFSHWGGEELLKQALEYKDKLKEEIKNSKENTNMSEPLDRLEPSTVIIDFIRQITQKMKRVTSDLYLEKNEKDGDNSDYGHHLIDLNN